MAMTPRPARVENAVDVGCCAAITALAAWTYVQFLPEARMLWSAWSHDRNGHLNFAVELALALRDANPARFLAVLSTSTIWGPLHGLILAPVLAIGGLDHRLGVLPSLVGWIVTLSGVGWLARHLAPDRAVGTAAAAIAVLFALAGAAHRAYSVDVMLESLGAALSIMALVCYVRALHAPAERGRWRALAIVLTALFFEKVNYWALVAVALSLAAIWDHRVAVTDAARSLRPRAWLLAQSRRWDNYVWLALVAVIVAIALRGPTSITIGGRSVSLYPPGNLATLAYAWVLTRVAIAAWRARDLRARLPLALGTLAAWHAWPIAWSLAIPRRLGPMLWYLGPANAGDAFIHGPIGAFQMYVGAAQMGYLAGQVGIALLLAGIAGWIAMRGRLRPGANAVLILFVVAAVAVVIHPNQKPRFLHSWFAAGWVVAAVGLAVAARALARSVRIGRMALVAVVLVVAALQAPHLLRIWRAAPFTPTGPASDLDLTDPLAEVIAEGGRVAVLGTVPFEALASWTTLTRARDISRFERVVWWRARDPRAFAEEFAAWLATTRATHVAVLEIPSSSPRILGTTSLAPALAGLPALMRAQDRFARGEVRRVDDVEISIWRRAR